MKRYILNIVLFFAIVAVCDFCFGFVCDYMQNHPKGGETKQLNDLMLHDCHDVLFMGSSRAYHHYDPDVFEKELGLECYNAGFDGSGVILAYPILHIILDRCKPKLVVYEITAGFDIVKNSSDDNNLRYIARLKPYHHIPIVRDVMWSVSKKSYLLLQSGLFRYNSEFLTIAINSLQTRQMEHKGYLPLEGTYKSKNTHHTPLNEEYDGIKLHWLEQLANIKNEHNVNMVWVMSPIYDSYNEKQNLYAVAKELAANYNIPFFDHYIESDFVGRSELFKDATHLNATGAKLFSQKLSYELKAFIK